MRNRKVSRCKVNQFKALLPNNTKKFSAYHYSPEYYKDISGGTTTYTAHLREVINLTIFNWGYKRGLGEIVDEINDIILGQSGSVNWAISNSWGHQVSLADRMEWSGILPSSLRG